MATGVDLLPSDVILQLRTAFAESMALNCQVQPVITVILEGLQLDVDRPLPATPSNGRNMAQPARQFRFAMH
ncbi:MAG: hypothetical protein D4S02_06235 [Rhodocyclaceae bacterium]|nr:MAG: hypothetical protein D4S02_06235 [Rhodocyclaceae bacterium]